jgi:hypothetical protein
MHAYAKVSVRIDIEKSRYLLLEPVFVHYQVVNQGYDTVTITPPDIAMQFVVLDSETKIWLPQAVPDYFDPYRVIKPGEKIEATIDLLGYGRALSRMSYTPALPANRYTAYLVLETVQGSRITSNTIEFEVVEPTGVEKTAMAFILNADSLVILKNREAAYGSILRLYQEYPRSVYAPYAFFRSTLLFPFGDRKELLELCRNFIQRYTDSYYTSSALSTIVGYYIAQNDTSGAVDELRHFIIEYPNSRVSESARQRLSSLGR